MLSLYPIQRCLWAKRYNIWHVDIHTQSALPAPAACTICAWKFTLIIITVPPVLNNALLSWEFQKWFLKVVCGNTVSTCKEMWNNKALFNTISTKIL